MTLTLEQIEALEAYVTLGRKPSGDVTAKEKFRSAKAVLDEAGLTKKADAISRGYDLADALCQLARERLTEGTFQQGIEAAANWHITIAKEEEARANSLLALGKEATTEKAAQLAGRLSANKSISADRHLKSAAAIRNLKPETKP